MLFVIASHENQNLKAHLSWEIDNHKFDNLTYFSELNNKTIWKFKMAEQLGSDEKVNTSVQDCTMQNVGSGHVRWSDARIIATLVRQMS